MSGASQKQRLTVKSSQPDNTLVTARPSEQQYLRLAITTILAERSIHPGAAKIAIEYLKQGESQRNQKLIASIVAAERAMSPEP